MSFIIIGVILIQVGFSSDQPESSTSKLAERGSSSDIIELFNDQDPVIKLLDKIHDEISSWTSWPENPTDACEKFVDDLLALLEHFKTAIGLEIDAKSVAERFTYSGHPFQLWQCIRPSFAESDANLIKILLGSHNESAVHLAAILLVLWPNFYLFSDLHPTLCHLLLQKTLPQGEHSFNGRYLIYHELIIGRLHERYLRRPLEMVYTAITKRPGPEQDYAVGMPIYKLWDHLLDTCQYEDVRRISRLASETLTPFQWSIMFEALITRVSIIEGSTFLARIPKFVSNDRNLAEFVLESLIRAWFCISPIDSDRIRYLLTLDIESLKQLEAHDKYIVDQFHMKLKSGLIGVRCLMPYLLEIPNFGRYMLAMSRSMKSQHFLPKLSLYHYEWIRIVSDDDLMLTFNHDRGNSDLRDLIISLSAWVGRSRQYQQSLIGFNPDEFLSDSLAYDMLRLLHVAVIREHDRTAHNFVNLVVMALPLLQNFELILVSERLFEHSLWTNTETQLLVLCDIIHRVSAARIYMFLLQAMLPSNKFIPGEDKAAWQVILILMNHLSHDSRKEIQKSFPRFAKDLEHAVFNAVTIHDEDLHQFLKSIVNDKCSVCTNEFIDLIDWSLDTDVSLYLSEYPNTLQLIDDRLKMDPVCSLQVCQHYICQDCLQQLKHSVNDNQQLHQARCPVCRTFCPGLLQI